MKPTFMLASHLPTNIKDENGIRHAIPLNNDNRIVEVINKYVSRRQKFVFVANDPSAFDINDLRAGINFRSFEMSGLGFDECIVLDNRNKSQAREILDDADLIMLSGGKIICQIDFFNEIGLKSILENSHALVIGTSAGAMNLCNTVLNFPEELADLPYPRIVEGLGFYDNYIIPHFDGRNLMYQLPCDEIDIVKDYILPFSEKETLIGLHNDSYIILHDGKEEFVGEYYIIENSQVKILNDNFI